MWTAGATSGAERSLRVQRETLRFDTITIVGGGCYGGYYVRQLGRAEAAGAITWERLIVVDRDASCAVAHLPPDARPPAMDVVAAEWAPFFEQYLTGVTDGGADVSRDAIVPSPLMPHLMADWLRARAASRWPERRIEIQGLGSPPDVPWQRAGDDLTHYVSFAEWMCPINCIEPARCPHTRGPRDWSMPSAIAQYAESERAAGRPVEGPFVFHCTHRTHGVGMIDVAAVVAADRAIAEHGAGGEASFLVGTASHCHGAIQRFAIRP
ncbi:MAG: hypothetical protein ABIY52_10425 [Gemmatimonadaceae bacterium]